MDTFNDHRRFLLKTIGLSAVASFLVPQLWGAKKTLSVPQARLPVVPQAEARAVPYKA